VHNHIFTYYMQTINATNKLFS